ncbi:hypothetical protein SEA_EMSQUAREDA_33 [Gordonia phage EMsquaredA]|nr:hypothetical protein SEA_EMSQUAREDA_33 [Gordonia phage EMsquaredA]
MLYDILATIVCLASASWLVTTREDL